MEVKIPALDTAAEAAKEFLQKVITPPLEEVGGLLADQVKLWRFKNQITILQKAEDHLKSKGLNTRKVSLKTLTPLLEFSSVEEEPSLQQKWAALIANTVKEHSRLDTTLYSHLLSQLNKRDAEVFETIFELSIQRSKDRQTTIHIPGDKIFDYSLLHMQYNDIGVIIDNLIRLRLVSDHFTRGNVVLSDLGFSFMNACTFAG